MYKRQVNGGKILISTGKGVKDSPGFSITSSETINDGLWHHILLTWSGDTTNNGVKLYIDGELNSQTTANAKLTSHTNNLNVGTYNFSSSTAFNGSLDNIRIYDRVLETTEIEALYSEGEKNTP